MVTARDSLIVLLVTASVTLVLTPVARLLATRVGAVVAPDDRRVHERPTPATGGWAMILGLVAGLAVASRLDSFRSAFSDTSEPVGVLLAAVIVFMVGAVDDLRPISPPAKLAGQVSAGIVLSLLGVTLFYLRLPYVDLISVSPDIAPIVTVIWLMLMANAINLIDGLDGLASGIVAIASGSFFLYSLRLLDAGLINETTSARCCRSSPAASASASFPTTSTRPASSWATPAPCCSACSWRRRRSWSGAGSTTSSAARRTSSSPRSSSRSSSSACRWWTPPSPSSGGPAAVPAWPPPTRSTCTTGSCAWATASAAC